MVHHRLDDDPGMAGEEGEAAHHLPDGGEATLFVDGTDEAQGLLGAFDGAVARAGDEREALIVVDGEVAHPHDDLAEVGAEDLLRPVGGRLL